MKFWILGTAATVLAGAVAIAQPPAAPPAPPTMHGEHHRMMAQPMTRDGAVAKVREHFAQMDENRDGFVTQDEMREARQERRVERKEKIGERRAKRVAMRDPNAAFERLDANKDGSISRDEFAKAREMRIEKRVEMRGDAPRAGGKRMMRMGGMGGHGMMMRMADADKDGKVSLAEAQAAAVSHFDMMDANRDGQVTADERRGARQKMRAMHAPKAS
jgi:hypothetical protein